MTVNTLIILLCFIVSLLPSGIVAVVLFLRQEALRTDGTSVVIGITKNREITQALSETVTLVENRLADARAEVAHIKTRMTELEESMVRLSNKWNARISAERRAEAKIAKENSSDDVAPDIATEISPPGFDWFHPSGVPEQKPKPTNDKPTRRFGQI